MSLPDPSYFPSLAIVIVNWNSYEVTANCLESLRSLDYPKFTVVVVDNGSEDDSANRLVSSFPEITLLRNTENLGFTGGNNTGIQFALENDFELVMLLNNDTIVTPDLAGLLVKRLVSDPDIGAVQPKILYNKERDVIWNAGGAFNSFFFTSKTRGFNEKDLGQYDESNEVDWITGCCFLTRSEIIKQIGLLDQKFFIYYEDSDWSFKIRKLGYKLVYDGSSIVYHEVGMSEENRKGHNEGNVSPFAHYMVIRNHLYMVRRYARGVSLIGAWLNLTGKIVLRLGYFVIRGRFKKLRFALRGVQHGMTR
ncbi:glycosyltransferase family 2 protein [Roseivirga thermotolerans]|uniref:glycosyltransferase family 2 protein n=1 Tax=Roseivirga thermotolerans TaxID=1758176 RepID=UPI00273F2351|nr:glycosyltransferase family 2 protein [Roseivirga thermotolerans]